MPALWYNRLFLWPLPLVASAPFFKASAVFGAVSLSGPLPWSSYPESGLISFSSRSSFAVPCPILRISFLILPRPSTPSWICCKVRSIGRPPGSTDGLPSAAAELILSLVIRVFSLPLDHVEGGSVITAWFPTPWLPGLTPSCSHGPATYQVSSPPSSVPASASGGLLAPSAEVGLALSPDPETVACAGAVPYWRLAALDSLGLIRASSGTPVLERVGGSERVTSSGVAPF
jgi:hypothetical protein